MIDEVELNWLRPSGRPVRLFNDESLFVVCSHWNINIVASSGEGAAGAVDGLCFPRVGSVGLLPV